MRLWSVVVTQSIQLAPRWGTPRTRISEPFGEVWGGCVSAPPPYSDVVIWPAAPRLAALLLELLAHLDVQLLGPLDQLLLGVDPGLVLLLGHHGDLRAHDRVAGAAELRALAGEGAGRGRLEPGLVRVAGHRVRLAAELGDPPAVRHVVRLDVKRDGGVHGHHHL